MERGEGGEEREGEGEGGEGRKEGGEGERAEGGGERGEEVEGRRGKRCTRKHIPLTKMQLWATQDYTHVHSNRIVVYVQYKGHIQNQIIIILLIIQCEYPSIHTATLPQIHRFTLDFHHP